ncbi:hypothetical protein [Burkholderia anthina]|uniref:hypothetical protein n=1 Tax=Burkholderia anthina TaxID=179879 RepID=UPI00158AF94C|nr:hypothetical protein [Burkholderia anthina]
MCASIDAIARLYALWMRADDAAAARDVLDADGANVLAGAGRPVPVLRSTNMNQLGCDPQSATGDPMAAEGRAVLPSLEVSSG